MSVSEGQQASGQLSLTLAQALAGVHAALAEATSETELLAAAMQYLRRSGPASAFFVQVHSDDDGHVGDGEIAAMWDSGQIMRGHAFVGQRVALPSWGLTAEWSSNPHDPLCVADVEADSRCGEALRGRMHELGRRGLVVLPLYTSVPRAWHGLIVLMWKDPHEVPAEETTIYALLCDAVAAFAANLQIQRSLRAVLEETSLLYDLSAQLSVVDNVRDALAAVCRAANGVMAGFLSQLEGDVAAGTASMRVIAAWEPAGRSMAQHALGLQFPVQMTPMANLWINNPDEPVLISSVATDPRCDEPSRALFLQAGTVSAALVPLIVQGRPAGVVSLSWESPQHFGAREQRIYRSVSRHLGLVLDNRLMFDRTQQMRREQADRSEQLAMMLRHLPVGVAMVNVAVSQCVLSNTIAEELLAPLGLILRSGAAVATGAADGARLRYLEAGSDRELHAEQLPLARAIATGQTQRMDVDVVTAQPGDDAEKGAGDGDSSTASVRRRTIDWLAAPVLMAGADTRVQSVLLTMTDITERRTAEQARTRIQDELIAMQAAALAERSTPIIPISDDIVVVPIVGSLDTARSDQLMDTVPVAAGRYGAKVAIIDITGVGTLDTQAARTLIGAARALRFLGIEPIVTGMRAEVAQTLVTLGVRLDGITTRSNLKGGIAYAQLSIDQRLFSRLR